MLWNLSDCAISRERDGRPEPLDFNPSKATSNHVPQSNALYLPDLPANVQRLRYSSNLAQGCIQTSDLQNDVELPSQQDKSRSGK